MFINPNFIFNGKESSTMGLYISSYDNEIIQNIGLEYNESIEIDNTMKSNPLFREVDDTQEYSVTLNLLLYDAYLKKAVVWTEEIIEYIYDWLLTDEFVEFISYDNLGLIYYFKVTNIKKHFSFKREGYLEVTFRSLNKYAYEKYEKTITVNSATNLEITNTSSQPYEPIFEITNLGDTSTINKINNLEIKGLNQSQTIVLDNLTFIVEDVDTKSNEFSKCNRKWVKLARGKNTLTLSGNMELTIKCRFPVVP